MLPRTVKVVPMSDHTGLPSPSPSHAASDIAFKLGDGTSGIITTVQKNCFSRIIESHIPHQAGRWIPGENAIVLTAI